MAHREELVTFLYLLARDSVPVGEIQKHLEAAHKGGACVVFSNTHLASWAAEEADRILAPTGFEAKP